ncbi:MAG: efflux RND transporter permease subunit [Methylococcaceae bacterium]|nr:efflux RND transporter permease subunit [Methylococcaceae bacterium]
MHSIITFFVHNKVAANLLMVLIIAAGFFTLPTIPAEFLPSYEMNVISIKAPYQGATPSEVEEHVVAKIEEQIQDINGIEEITSVSSEGFASISVEINSAFNVRQVLGDIKERVDAITDFPELLDEIRITVAERKREVLGVVVSGQLQEAELQQLGKRIRDEILMLPDVSQATLGAIRPAEFSIEVSEQMLRQYGLSFQKIAKEINNNSLSMPAGSMKTDKGEVLLRTFGQSYNPADFARIPILKRDDGSFVLLGEIAEIKDGFEEEQLEATFNGYQSVIIEVFRLGDQSAIEISERVKKYITESKSFLPPGVTLNVWRDRAKIVKGRISTLTSNAIQGAVLVFILLTLFLRLSVATWVCAGIPISFLGALAMMPELGVTINISSLFAFILVLGIVVDDAIVTGENIYHHLTLHNDPEKAAIEGTHEVGVPVTFGVLTTVIAFLPLLSIEGRRGQMFESIALVVIPVLLFSLVESKCILPYHLKHLKITTPGQGKQSALQRLQTAIDIKLQYFISNIYKPTLEVLLEHRYSTLCGFIGLFIIMMSMTAGGQIRFVFFPKVESESIQATLTMPVGTPYTVTKKHTDRMTRIAKELQTEFVDPESGQQLITNILVINGKEDSLGHPQSNVGYLRISLLPPEQRNLSWTGHQVVTEWRKRVGSIPGAEKIYFKSDIFHGMTSPVEVQLHGDDFKTLSFAAQSTRTLLNQIPGLYDIEDTFEIGKEEVQIKLKPEAELLGLSVIDLSRQIRQGFYGEEVQVLQRQGEDIQVLLRYPLAQRKSMLNLNSMKIRTETGVEVNFSDVADITMSRGLVDIDRVNRKRVVTVKANLDKKSTNEAVLRELIITGMTEVKYQYPSINYSLEGEMREKEEAFDSVFYGTLFVLLGIYCLLAIPLQSYFQPLMVMIVIPFGITGAILGHFLAGIDLTVYSVLGIVALTGVVVNDSLVLVDCVNTLKSRSVTLFKAVSDGATRRFRAIILTSLTTFLGLAPLMLEKDTQAQFLIPMAVSLAYGIIYATLITLFLLPTLYLIFDDCAVRFRQLKLALSKRFKEI